MAILNFSKEYTGGGILNTIKSFLPVVCGVPLSAFSSTAKGKYSVVLRSTPRGETIPTITIGAWLQEKIKFEVSSDWSSVVDMGETGAVGDIFQLFGGSVQSTLSTRRKWKGTQPISMFFTLRFEALDDVKREVIEPCLRLQQLALPSGGVEISGEDFLLQPPGPNPFYLESLSTVDILGHKPLSKMFGKGEVIDIDIGNGFLKLGSSEGQNGVILKNVKVEFDNRMSKDGPIGAKVELEVQTYEMLTRKKLAQMYSMEEKSAFTNMRT